MKAAPHQAKPKHRAGHHHGIEGQLGSSRQSTR